MPFRLINDVRVKYTVGGMAHANIKVLGIDDPIGFDGSKPKLGAMLDLFGSGRDCYWDGETRTFTTMPVGPPDLFEQPSEISEGLVVDWELTVPLTGAADVLLIIDRPDAKVTSGYHAHGWKVFTVDEDELPVLLPLLDSPYLYFGGGALRNTEVVGDIGP